MTHLLRLRKQFTVVRPDCFVVKAGQSLKTLANSKMQSVFLTKSGDSCFAVTRENTTLMNILNKTIQTLPDSRLSKPVFRI